MSTRPTSVELDLEDGLQDVRQKLAEAAPETLLTAFASLTHRMHGAQPSTEHVRRMERDLVEAELLRRLRGVRTEQDRPTLLPRAVKDSPQA